MPIVVVVLLFLLVPLPLLALVKDIGIRWRANLLVFFWCALTSMKMIQQLTAGTSGTDPGGLGSVATHIMICCTATIVQRLARGRRRLTIRAYRIGRRSYSGSSQ
jgi:hypothetical protein